MTKHPPRQRFAYQIIIVVAIAITISAAALAYSPPGDAPTDNWFTDPEDDVGPSDNEPIGVIDITTARIDVQGDTVNITITVNDEIPDQLINGTYVRWSTTIILRNGVFRAYEVYGEMNATLNHTATQGFSRELNEAPELCVIHLSGNTLNLIAELEGLTTAQEIQWSIETLYERWADAELLASELDLAPDEGFQQILLN